jgi:uncharacterized protein
MIDEPTIKLIEDIKAEHKGKYPDFRGIYFFGSRARGDHHDDSDYDLALVFDREISGQFKDDVNGVIFDFSLDNDIFIDSWIFNTDDIADPDTQLRRNIKKEGIFYEI